MSESNEIKEQRKKKFLEKMQNKNKKNMMSNKEMRYNEPQNVPNFLNYPQNNFPQINNNQQPQNFQNFPQNYNHQYFNNYQGNQQNYFNPSINQNFQQQNNERDKYKEVNLKEKYTNLNKYQKNIDFIGKIKKVLLIILIFFHCAEVKYISNTKEFIMTFILIEFTTNLYQMILYQKRRKLIPNNQQNNQNSNTNKIENYTDYAINNFGYVDVGLKIFQILYEIISDICLIIFLNIINISIK